MQEIESYKNSEINIWEQKFIKAINKPNNSTNLVINRRFIFFEEPFIEGPFINYNQVIRYTGGDSLMIKKVNCTKEIMKLKSPLFISLLFTKDKKEKYSQRAFNKKRKY